jgi:hypothetical protein
VILFRPIAYADRSVPESTLGTRHFGWSGSARLADTEERLLINSKRFSSFNPRTPSRRRWCGRRSGRRSGLWRRLWRRRRSRLWCGLGGGLWGRCWWFWRGRFWRGRFRNWRSWLASLLDFNKLIRKGVAYHNGYAFILDHTVRN